MRFFTLCLGLVVSFNLMSKEVVKVGVYDFPPYAFVSGEIRGITVQVLEAMNRFQQDYEFVAVPTTARRRYLDFDNGEFDMLIFESIHWGWLGHDVQASEVFVKGAEVYVTQAQPGRGQAYFTDFKNKLMIGVLGYHYQFADFSGDQEYLRQKFNMIQTEGQQKSLELILKGRGDIAVLTKEYLHYHFLSSPRDRKKLLISVKYDQIYEHTILIRKQHKLAIAQINRLLAKMHDAGILKPIWQKYGLQQVY